MNTLNALIDNHARNQPNARALIYRKQIISYIKFKQRCNAVAANLARLGIHQGDRVALWLPNIPAWLELFFACAQLGAIAVAVNTRFRSSEVGDLLERSGSKLLISWPNFIGIDFYKILGEIDTECLAAIETIVTYDETNELSLGELDQRPTIAYDSLLRSSDTTPVQAQADAGCIIFTTSGTTKLPKLVLHTQSGVE